MTTNQSLINSTSNRQLYILSLVFIHWCYPGRTCFSRQIRPVWAVWRRFCCERRGGGAWSQSQRVVDPSLPPWSPLTQMERPNCSGCLTIKAPMVELNYTNSKQFFISAGHKTTQPACLSAPPGRPSDSLLRLSRRCSLSSEGTFANSELDESGGTAESHWCTGLKHVCAVLWKIKGKRDAEHVDQSVVERSRLHPKSFDEN